MARTCRARRAGATFSLSRPLIVAAAAVLFSIDYGDAVLCPACIAAPPAFDRARSAVVYDDASHRLVVGFKYSDRLETAPMFANWMIRAGGEMPSADALTAPAPLHLTRLLARRYHQSAILARWIARNVAGAFAAPARSLERVRGAHRVLVDDVLKTGATLSSCARALKRQGACLGL